MRHHLRSLSKFARRKRFGPQLSFIQYSGLKRLGSKYGGWFLLDTPDLHGSTIISCGLGEDASFDVEFAAAYNATVIVVDPTPRALAHFREFTSRVGLPSIHPYSNAGRQKATSYNLENVSLQQFELLPCAISTKPGTARFFAPSNLTDVSHSLNAQLSTTSSSTFIDVKTVSINELIANFGRNIPLVKLDIESSELEVIPTFLAAGFFPHQLLVEFDFLNFPSRGSTSSFLEVHQQLLNAGYVIGHFDQRSNFLYVRFDK